MRKFLKKLQKGLKTACLAAALATCWSIGQTARADPPNYGDEVVVRFSGTVSPAQNDISHLFLIYTTGSSGIDYPLKAVKLGDFPAGLQSPFSVEAEIVYSSTLFWYAAGLYGDVSSNQYTTGVNGVTLGLYNYFLDDWDSCYSIEEEIAFGHLLNDAPEQLPSYDWNWRWRGINSNEFDHFTTWATLYDFSSPTENGQISFNVEIIPEPVSIVLFGTGGMIVIYLRRRNK
jgi:hypothetical protein